MEKVTLLFVLLLLMFSGCADNTINHDVVNDRYQEGFDNGHKIGYAEGYSDGVYAYYYEEADFHDDFCQDLIWFYKENACIVFPGSKECHIFECDLVQEMFSSMEYYDDAEYSFFDQQYAKKQGYTPHSCLVFFNEDVEPVDLSISK